MDKVHAMHAPPVDLQFLYVLEALYEEGSVTAAAERLGLSQTALSHGLARLRTRFGDPLFVKTASGMQPTPLAERLAHAARKVLREVRQDILRVVPFDPGKSDRIFTLCMSDMGGAVLLHRIVKRIAAEAPGVRIRPLQVKPEDIAGQLASGQIDLAIGFYPEMDPGLFQQSLFRRTHVCIVRRDHPRIHATLSLRQFVDTPHILAATIAGANRIIDRELQRRGLRRRVALEVPYLLAVPNIIAESDYVAMVPTELAELSQRVAAVRILKMPMKSPEIVIRQYWHRRVHAEADSRWLRATIQAVLGE